MPDPLTLMVYGYVLFLVAVLVGVLINFFKSRGTIDFKDPRDWKH